MAQLLVRNLSEALVKTLRQSAAEHGVSAEEEHRRILEEALAPAIIETDEKFSLFDHIRLLGEIAPDFELEPDQQKWSHREIEF